MRQINVDIKKAGKQLATLISDVARGKEIVFTKGDAPVAKLISFHPKKRRLKSHRVFGGAKHLILSIAPDFDAPLPDFAEYMK
ncbi:MAG: type II toxin-antitoxin system prevent-host-death family antitoxin [Chloroflexota bacterium]